MSNNELPFYTQSAILDTYIHTSNPETDPDVVEIIIEMLRSNPELRDYFFRSRPNAAWAAILWGHGFFESPPRLQETETGYTLPRWDVQAYLISVADQVPDIVIKHIETIQGHGWYKGQAIRALCYIPTQEVVRVVPRIIEWLKDPEIANIIVQQVYDLMLDLAKSQHSAAFSLFQALTDPIPLPDAKGIGGFLLGGGATSKFRRDWFGKQIFSQGLESLRKLNLQQTVSILEEHLRAAMRIEAQVMNSPDFEFSSGWRTAIADTGQDLDNTYRDILLLALRDMVEIWVQQNSEEVEPLIERYLTEKHEIIRRLGLHLLYRFPKQYQRFVIQELHNTANLDNIGIHHEFFMLLQEGYPYLEIQDQDRLLAEICKGPDPEDTRRLAAWAQEMYGIDPDEYIERYTKEWIRDRLWMLKEYLIDQPKQVLDELIDKLGEPEHPAFTRWSTGTFSVQEVSPITDQEMSQMTSDELVNFLNQWRPDPNREFGPWRISYGGMANTVARLITAQPQKYANHLMPIALQRPEYAYALLSQSVDREQANYLPWGLSIDLCEQLLADEIVRNSINRVSDYSWVSVRQSIVRLLGLGLNNVERAIPAEYLSRVRDILIILVDDPDPIPEHDRPAEGWGHNDPATVAINHVRPSALLALIEYARNRATIERDSKQEATLEEPYLKRLEAGVSELLTRKLDRHQDSSWAVHSVYGRYLLLLYWLDKEWVEQQIDQIFPEADNEENVWLFAAAWDSYVAYNNRTYKSLLDLLHPKYRLAINNLSRGYITKTHFRPEQGLASHLVWEYLVSDYDLHSAVGQQSLIVTFFNQAPSEVRDSAAWILYRIYEVPANQEVYWPRVRVLWEWRANEASAANHSVDFDAEMHWFARLPMKVPRSETISSLWPLLEGLIPHVTRSESGRMGWDAIEEYLAREVDRDPLKVIQLYRLMHEQVKQPIWFYPTEETRKIIEVAAANQNSRYEALSLINSLARSGHHQYRDIYEMYAG